MAPPLYIRMHTCKYTQGIGTYKIKINALRNIRQSYHYLGMIHNTLHGVRSKASFK